MTAALVQASYFLAIILFILGLKRMSSPVTARAGIIWAGWGMVLATVATFLWPGMQNFGLMILGIALGGGIAWYTGKRVAMTDMPQMIAIYNGMGGGAAGAIAAVELFKEARLIDEIERLILAGRDLEAEQLMAQAHGMDILTLAVLGALIGSVAFSGSMIAFAKLQGLIKRAFTFPQQQVVNLLVFGVAVVLGILALWTHSPLVITLFFITALAFGVLMTLPIGGADMPVVISLYNALTGLAVAFEGFVLNNAAMIIAGTVVGAAGTLLTQLMAKAMNRPLTAVLFRSFGQTGEGAAVGAEGGSLKPIEADDAGIMLAYANKVLVVPGYGMAVAQAQHKVWELCQLLQERGVMVKFAIHPVAGRMPGHMNVLLAEAGVPYDKIYDLDEINPEFPTADAVLVIGANDVVNPMARTNPESPIYGMPILNADQAKNVLVVKRGQGKGFSGIENALFYADNARMLYGDGQEVASKLIQAVKGL
jgi:H+-translocating NAD(P) transhydrogenase subunit beta